MEGLDAITFTGGIGQRDAELRAEILKSLEFLGMKINIVNNNNNRTYISSNDSKIKTLVIETNEEIVVARETKKVIEKINSGKHETFSARQGT